MALRFYYLTIFAALGAYLPFFPAWLEGRGLRGLQMSAITALLPALGMLSPPLLGMLADRLALRGSLLRVACAGAFVAFTGLVLLSIGTKAPEFWAIFSAMFVFGVFRSPMMMLADVVALEQRVSYGKLRSWGSIGFLSASLVLGSVLDPRAASGVPIAIAALLFISLLASLALPTRARVPPGPVLDEARALLRSKDFRLFAGVAFCWMASLSGYDLTLSLHLRDLGASGSLIGAAWAVATVAEVLLMNASGPLLQRFPSTGLLAVGLGATVVRWLLLSSIRSPLTLLFLQPLHALSFGLVWVSAIDFLRSRAAPHALATAQGLFAAATAVGGTLGMLVWGPIYARAGGPSLFLVTAGVACVGTATAVLLSVVARRHAPALSELRRDASAEGPTARSRPD